MHTQTQIEPKTFLYNNTKSFKTRVEQGTSSYSSTIKGFYLIAHNKTEVSNYTWNTSYVIIWTHV